MLRDAAGSYDAAQQRSERVADNEIKQRLAAILAADAVGFSRLMGSDERATIAELDANRALFRLHAEAHGGRIVDMAEIPFWRYSPRPRARCVPR